MTTPLCTRRGLCSTQPTPAHCNIVVVSKTKLWWKRPAQKVHSRYMCTCSQWVWIEIVDGGNLLIIFVWLHIQHDKIYSYQAILTGGFSVTVIVLPNVQCPPPRQENKQEGEGGGQPSRAAVDVGAPLPYNSYWVTTDSGLYEFLIHDKESITDAVSKWDLAWWFRLHFIHVHELP